MHKSCGDDDAGSKLLNDSGYNTIDGGKWKFHKEDWRKDTDRTSGKDNKQGSDA